MPKLSIIVPVYNVEEYLEKCLDSLVNQTMKDIEILVINDGSPDNSQRIIDAYASEYPDLIFSYQKENGGLGDARNFAIPYCKGEYIAFIDSDDYVREDFAEKTYQYAKENNLDIVMFNAIWFYPDGTEEKRSIFPRFVSGFNDKAYILAQPAAWNKIYKREIWTKSGLKFPVQLWYEDLATIPITAKYTSKIGYLEEELYYYRQRQNSIMSNTKYSPRLLEIITACDLLYQGLKGTAYQEEMEYVILFQLIYFASYRFIEYDKYEDIQKCVEYVQEKFPNWRKNTYYQKRPKTFKMLCELIVRKRYKIVKFLMMKRNNP